MLKPPHPVARLAYALAMWINPNKSPLDGGRATSAMEKRSSGRDRRHVRLEKLSGPSVRRGTMANLEALWVAGQLQPGKKILAANKLTIRTGGSACSAIAIRKRAVRCAWPDGRKCAGEARGARRRGDGCRDDGHHGNRFRWIRCRRFSLCAQSTDSGFTPMPRTAVIFVLTENLGEDAERAVAQIEKRTRLSSIRTNTDCSPTGAAACSFAIPEWADCTSTILPTRISAPRSCTWAR